MSKGTLGSRQQMAQIGQQGLGQMLGPGAQPGFGGPQTHEYRPFPEAIGGPAIDIFEPMPGYQQPQQPNQGQQQQQQYFQQMHKNTEGMNEALGQIEQMQMPGGQYGGGFAQPGGMFGGGGKGKGGISF